MCDPDSRSLGLKIQDAEREKAKSRIEWEDLQVFPECVVAGLGDESLEYEERWSEGTEFPFPQLFNSGSGFGMLYGLAEADGIYTETGSLDGVLVGARIEFVNDIARLLEAGEGEWRRLGFMRVGSRGAIAIDKRQQQTPDYHSSRHEIPLPEGWYEAETFISDRDHLGLRLISVELQA